MDYHVRFFVAVTFICLAPISTLQLQSQVQNQGEPNSNDDIPHVSGANTRQKRSGVEAITTLSKHVLPDRNHRHATLSRSRQTSWAGVPPQPVFRRKTIPLISNTENDVINEMVTSESYKQFLVGEDDGSETHVAESSNIIHHVSKHILRPMESPDQKHIVRTSDKNTLYSAPRSHMHGGGKQGKMEGPSRPQEKTVDDLKSDHISSRSDIGERDTKGRVILPVKDLYPPKPPPSRRPPPPPETPDWLSDVKVWLRSSRSPPDTTIAAYHQEEKPRDKVPVIWRGDAGIHGHTKKHKSAAKYDEQFYSVHVPRWLEDFSFHEYLEEHGVMLIIMNNRVVPFVLGVYCMVVVTLSGLVVWRRALYRKNKRHVIRSLEGPDQGKYPYIITLVTGEVEGSGTSGCVCLWLRGSLATSGPYYVTGSARKYDRLLKQDSSISFVIYSPEYLGELSMIEVILSPGYVIESWFLCYATVTDLVDRRRWYFPCHSWLCSVSDKGRNAVLFEGVDTKYWLLQDNLNRCLLRHHAWWAVFDHRQSGLLQALQLLVCFCVAAAVMHLHMYLVTETNTLSKKVWTGLARSMLINLFITAVAGVVLGIARFIRRKGPFKMEKDRIRKEHMKKNSSLPTTHVGAPPSVIQHSPPMVPIYKQTPDTMISQLLRPPLANVDMTPGDVTPTFPQMDDTFRYNEETTTKNIDFTNKDTREIWVKNMIESPAPSPRNNSAPKRTVRWSSPPATSLVNNVMPESFKSEEPEDSVWPDMTKEPWAPLYINMPPEDGQVSLHTTDDRDSPEPEREEWVKDMIRSPGSSPRHVQDKMLPIHLDSDSDDGAEVMDLLTNQSPPSPGRPSTLQLSLTPDPTRRLFSVHTDHSEEENANSNAGHDDTASLTSLPADEINKITRDCDFSTLTSGAARAARQEDGEWERVPLLGPESGAILTTDFTDDLERQIPNKWTGSKLCAHWFQCQSLGRFLPSWLAGLICLGLLAMTCILMMSCGAVGLTLERSLAFRWMDLTAIGLMLQIMIAEMLKVLVVATFYTYMIEKLI